MAPIYSFKWKIREKIILTYCLISPQKTSSMIVFFRFFANRENMKYNNEEVFELQVLKTYRKYFYSLCIFSCLFICYYCGFIAYLQFILKSWNLLRLFVILEAKLKGLSSIQKLIQILSRKLSVTFIEAYLLIHRLIWENLFQYDYYLHTYNEINDRWFLVKVKNF